MESGIALPRPPDVVAQLLHLLNLSTIPQIDLRVVPFTAGAHKLPETPFTVLTVPYPYSDLTFADGSASPLKALSPGCGSLIASHDGLIEFAASPEDSRAQIQTRVDQLG